MSTSVQRRAVTLLIGRWSGRKRDKDYKRGGISEKRAGENRTASMAAGSVSKLQLVHRHIRAFPDFPKKGILFRDICPILKDPAALTAVIDLFEEHVRNNHQQVDLIVGLDARGFLFGPLLSQRLGIGFVLIRKKGKLPGATVSVSYDLEYGKAEAEVQEDAVAAGQKVLLIDDLLATGGTLYAACELMKKLQAEVLGCMVVIELKELNGIDKLKLHNVFSLVQY
ncbi:adenine phosphoribosyltransferase [Acanthochromis polyacanthus]|uniref:Adenine phosphoribosyltransferase n=1 Tax=Acanthochromis polyacanthus TaxID=80966 RepID=A0A3Q1FYW1_9TELE|nr:adenine phosphoribosyltransferase [Acanthochromis polyacanthus]